MFILILLTICIIFIRGLHLLYLFQIKEYRFDRLLSAVRERGILKSLYFSRNRLPALSIRNFLIVGFLSGVDLLLLLLAIEENTIYIALTYAVLLSPFIAFAIIALAVYLTEIPVQLYRSILILRAQLQIRNSKTIFIGVSGSYGKTSVKEYLSHILQTTYKVQKTPKNMNTDIGIALSILRYLKHDTEYFIVEVGAYRAGEIRNATWYIPFRYGILTGLGNQHVDLYGSRDILIQEESSILYQIAPTGTAYINSTIPNKAHVLETVPVKKVLYGLAHADITAKILELRSTKTRARIRYKGYEFIIQTALLGAHSVENLLPAIAIAIDLGIKPQDIIRAVSSIEPIEGKLSLHTGHARSHVLNDAVNSNVNGFLAALDVLRTFPQNPKYVASQGVIELGVEKGSSYRQILEKLHHSNAKLLTTDPLFSKLDTNNRVMTFNDVWHLEQKLLSLMNRHTVILLEGKFPKEFIHNIL